MSTGQEASLYLIGDPEGLQVGVSDFGAIVVNIFVPDRDGNRRDVVLGYDDVTGYENSPGFYGAFIGRCANRIKDGEFLIGGKRYLLSKNEGRNSLHSGPDTWNKRVFKVSGIGEDSVTFSLMSPDLDQGFPGDIDVFVTYRIEKKNRFVIEYKTVVEGDTIVNLTNHSFFNLNGDDGADVRQHLVWINADAYTEVDAELIPTGNIIPVAGTPYDFTSRKAFGQDIDPVGVPAAGKLTTYDVNFCLLQSGFRMAANAYSPETGILMNVYTDCPGLQVYSPPKGGNVGKKGTVYGPYAAMCFETQFFPDAIHQPRFASPIVRTGDTQETKTVYEFETVTV